MNGLSVIQLEQAVGSAIKNFRGGKGINVNIVEILPLISSFDPIFRSRVRLWAHTDHVAMYHETVQKCTGAVFLCVPDMHHMGKGFC